MARVLFLLAFTFSSALALAQSTPLPILSPIQRLTPTNAEIYPTPDSPPSELGFGYTLALDERTAMVSLSNADHTNGRVAVFERGYRGGIWQRSGSIEAPNTPAAAGFSQALAIDGDYALISASHTNYLYHRHHGQWTQADELDGIVAFDAVGQAIEAPYVFIEGQVFKIDAHNKLRPTQLLVGDEPTGPVNEDGFGQVVSVSEGTVAISAPVNNVSRGAVFIYELRGNHWIKTQKLAPSDLAIGDEFGVTMALSGDILAVGATGKDYNFVDANCNNAPTSGVVYIFTRIHGVWKEQQQIKNPCIYGFATWLSASRDHVAIAYPTYYLSAQWSDMIVYERNSRHHRAGVTFTPIGNLGRDNPNYGSIPALFGPTLFVGDGSDPTYPPGDVDVYDLQMQPH